MRRILVASSSSPPRTSSIALSIELAAGQVDDPLQRLLAGSREPRDDVLLLCLSRTCHVGDDSSRGPARVPGTCRRVPAPVVPGSATSCVATAASVAPAGAWIDDSALAVERRRLGVHDRERCRPLGASSPGSAGDGIDRRATSRRRGAAARRARELDRPLDRRRRQQLAEHDHVRLEDRRRSAGRRGAGAFSSRRDDLVEAAARPAARGSSTCGSSRAPRRRRASRPARGDGRRSASRSRGRGRHARARRARRAPAFGRAVSRARRSAGRRSPRP